MLAPAPIVHDPTCLLAEVRSLLSLQPALHGCPERVAALLGVDEHVVRTVLEVLEVDGEVLA